MTWGRRSLAWALVAVAVALAACAGDGPGGEAARPPDGALLDFVRCLRERGVNVADPSPGDNARVRPGPGPLTPLDELQAADAECRRRGRGPEDAGDRVSGADQADVADRALTFARCARDAGYPVPDPVVEDGRVVNWSPERLGIDLDDPGVNRDYRRCRDLSRLDPADGQALSPGAR